jgi:glucosamine-6-phosphate deaminase
MLKEFKVDKLEVKIHPDRSAMGKAAADMVHNRIIQLLDEQEFVNIIFAAAPSQNEFLGALQQYADIDWNRINAFHMDEYIGLPQHDPASFSSFLKGKVFDHLPFGSINYLNGHAANMQQECERYAQLLENNPADIVCMGIGENGHIAFNDPHVADFNDPAMVKIVELDLACRQQQVNDGCFPQLQKVPAHAITLTIPALIAGKYIYSMVPGKTKSHAVYQTLFNQVSEACPASCLRNHNNVILFLDKDSSDLIKGL